MAARRDVAIREKILVGISGRAANQQSRIRIKSKRMKSTGRGLRRRREGVESIRKQNHPGRRLRKSLALFGRVDHLLVMVSGKAGANDRSLSRRNEMEIKRNGSQPSSKGPADWFTGKVRIDPSFDA